MGAALLQRGLINVEHGVTINVIRCYHGATCELQIKSRLPSTEYSVAVTLIQQAFSDFVVSIVSEMSLFKSCVNMNK